MTKALSANAYLGFCLLALGLLILDGRILRLFKRGVDPAGAPPVPQGDK